MKNINTTIEAKVSAIKFNGYRIELSTNIKGKPVARLYRILTAGKNKGEAKLVQGFYFNDETRREVWVKEQITKVKANADAKGQKAAKLAEIRSNFENPYKVGDVLYDSWGYDQTNIDFYVVEQVKGKSVLLQRIGEEMVEGTSGFMCSNVRPNVSDKIGEPEAKVVQCRIWGEKPTYYIKSSHRGWISPYTAGKEGVYSSWYA